MIERTGEFRVEMPDGLTVERLPVGRANGRWHVAFICSGVDFFEGAPPRAARFVQEFDSRVTITAVGDELEWCAGGSGGGDDSQEVRMQYRQNGMTALEIRYLCDGAVVAEEVLDLS